MISDQLSMTHKWTDERYLRLRPRVGWVLYSVAFKITFQSASHLLFLWHYETQVRVQNVCLNDSLPVIKWQPVSYITAFLYKYKEYLKIDTLSSVLLNCFHMLNGEECMTGEHAVLGMCLSFKKFHTNVIHELCRAALSVCYLNLLDTEIICYTFKIRNLSHSLSLLPLTGHLWGL